MNDVKNGTTSLKDFNAYLCDFGKTPVTIKGKDEKHDFAWACTHFSNAKKGGLFNKHLIKIKKVTLTRQGDCVTLIDIAY